MRLKNREVFFALLGLSTVAGAYALLDFCAGHPESFNWLRPNAVVKRPYDMIPVVLLVITGSLLAGVFSRRLHSPT